jgi:hypothetical protein
MVSKRVVLYILLAVGVLLIGIGVWKLVGRPETVTPAGSPIISMKTEDDNVSTQEYLYIYENREVMLIWDIEKRPGLGRNASRIWRQGSLTQDEFDNLIQLFKDNIGQLQENYQFPGYGSAETGMFTGNMNVTISINYQGMSKTVIAKDYLSMYSSYSSGTYAGMPAPLDRIAEKLNEISMSTVEISREPPATTSDSSQIVDLVSISGPIPPINPGGPNVEITLKNVWVENVISLTATLEINRSFVFNFDVTSSSPLLPDTTISSRQNLIGGGFSDSVDYTLTIIGTTQGGAAFEYTEQVKIAHP